MNILSFFILLIGCSLSIAFAILFTIQALTRHDLPSHDRAGYAISAFLFLFLTSLWLFG